MGLQLEKIKQVIQENDYAKTTLEHFLELILLVDVRFQHIQQLETLGMLFDGGLNSFHKEYYKDLDFLAVECGHIAENTRRNHYEKEPEKKLPDVYTLWEELLGTPIPDMRIPTSE